MEPANSWSFDQFFFSVSITVDNRLGELKRAGAKCNGPGRNSDKCWGIAQFEPFTNLLASLPVGLPVGSFTVSPFS